MYAIILSRRDWREYDQIISAYTKERGKIELLARGVKKITSKNAAHLEPFSFVEVEVAKGKEIDHLTTVVPRDFFSGIRVDLEKSAMAGAAVSLTDRLVEVGVTDTRVFATLLSWLRFVEAVHVAGTCLLDGYVVVLLECLGFTPILDRCVICFRSFQEIVGRQLEYQPSSVKSKIPGLYFAGGGLICGECRGKKSDIGEQIVDCRLQEASVLELLLRGDWWRNNEFPLTGEEEKKLHALVYNFVLYHTERKMGDWNKFLP
ncbi:MAG: DNA repair protein RecO [Candidatus Magasanikbacteria bacterium]|nr:DNA repair protein RecO [Candidatus Magasanikbacteria bacterium]